MTQYIVV